MLSILVRRRNIAIFVTIFCLAAFLFVKGFFVSRAQKNVLSGELPTRTSESISSSAERNKTPKGTNLVPVPALFFSAIGNGSTGPDLFKLETASVPQSIPVRTDPSAGFGSYAGQYGGFRELGGSLYFFADTAGEFGALFRRDSNDMLSQISGANSTGEDAHFTYFDNGLYFRALTALGDELVRLDGSGAATAIDVNPNGNGNSFAGRDGGFAAFDGGLYFSAETPAAGNDLFRLNAGSSTAVPVEINPGNASNSFAGTDAGFFVYNNRLYFNAFVAADGTAELLQLDAGSSTPVPVRDAGNNIVMHNFGSVSSFHVFAGSLYLGNANPMTGGDTLIKIDSAGVATAFQYMGSDLNNAGQIGGFVEFAGDLYFSATTPATGRDLFKISAGGTVTAIDLTNSGSFDAFDLNNNSGFIVFNNELYFTAYNLGGDALYRLNGAGVVTPVLNNGTTMAGVYGGFKIFANDLYFSAVDPANGYELFKLDTSGTLSSYDIKNDGNGNSEAGNPGGFFVFPAAAPTAAAVSVGGRVTTQNGAGLSGATVTLQDENGATSSAITNPFGYYLFSGIQAGRGYTFTAAKKQYGFAPRIVVVNDELTDLDFVATSQ